MPSTLTAWNCRVPAVGWMTPAAVKERRPFGAREERLERRRIGEVALDDLDARSDRAESRDVASRKDQAAQTALAERGGEVGHVG